MKKITSIVLSLAVLTAVSVLTINGKKSRSLYKPFHKSAIVGGSGEEAEFAGARDFYAMIRNNPTTGVINPSDIYAMYQQLDMMGNNAMNKVNPMNWISMGPDNQGGRTLALLVDKDSANIVYAGAASGGLWISRNGGGYWTLVSGGATNFAVSSIAQASNGTVYFGTGEDFYGNAGQGNGNSGVMGRGIFKFDKSTNIVTQLTATDPSTPYSGASMWDYVYSIVVGQNDKLIAGNAGGIYVSTDGGNKWTKSMGSGTTKIGAGYNLCTDVIIASDLQTVYCVVQPSGYSGAKYYRSDDAGANWTEIGTKLNHNVTRARMAIAASKENTVYILASTGAGTLNGVYRSDDKGATFSTALAGGSMLTDPFMQTPNGTHAQGNYDLVISVDPVNENKVFIGGIEIHMGVFGSNGLWQWALISGGSNNVHADQHAMTFDKMSNPKVMYIGCDGGIYKSTNDFSSTVLTKSAVPMFKRSNTGYVTTQFYAIAACATYKELSIGGTQDNGTQLVFPSLSYTGKSGIEVYGGDGFYSAISHLNTRTIFGESQYGEIGRALDGANYSSLFDPANKKIQPGENGGNPQFGFNTPYRLWEREEIDTAKDIAGNIIYDTIKGVPHMRRFVNLFNSKFFLAGLNGLFVTSGALSFDHYPIFYNVSPSWGIYPTCIEYAPDGNTVYVGCSYPGKVYRISGLNKFKQWKSDTAGNFDPTLWGIKTDVIGSWGQTITGIGVDKNDGSRVVVTLGNYGTTDHIVMSTNALDSANKVSFTSISGNLNNFNFPVYDAEIDFANPNTVTAATEIGVWRCNDITASPITWTEQNTGLGRVPCFMLVQDTFNRLGAGSIYYLASHGRGMWRCESSFILGVDQASAPVQHTNSLSLYPNPAREVANVSVNLSERTDVNVMVFDLQGRVIENSHYGEMNSGSHSFTLNTANYKAGTYIVRTYGKNFDKTAKMLIVQ